VRFAWLCSHESYQPEELLEQAVAAEQAGFDMVTGADHFHPWVDDRSASSFVWTWFGGGGPRPPPGRRARPRPPPGGRPRRAGPAPPAPTGGWGRG
jgi:hypothetical protein